MNDLAHLKIAVRKPESVAIALSRLIFCAFTLFLAGGSGQTRPGSASWTPLNNLAPTSGDTMILLTDGTVMFHSDANWMRLTPDSLGNYVNGTWSTLSPMSIPRLYFASNMLRSGKVFVLGGEYTGTALVANYSATGEIYDPVANTWTALAPYPSQDCDSIFQYGGIITTGSSIVTGMAPPSTAGFQVGWSVFGYGIPANTTILSIDSSSQIHLSQDATYSGSVPMSLGTQNAGNVTAGSTIITGLSSTFGYHAGWSVKGFGIPGNTYILSVDSPSQIHITRNATLTYSSDSLTLGISYRPTSCFGDDPSMLLPSGEILAGDIFTSATNLFDPVTNSWSPGGSKVYDDQSDEEGWTRLSDGTILTYDLWQSVSAGSGYAEKFDPVTNTWASVSPADGTANGTLPVLSSPAIGYELGPILRLQDGRALVIGANGQTALYTPSTNTWGLGPNLEGILDGIPFLFAADDAPAAILPNGHVILAADAGNGVSTTGNVTYGFATITNISVSVLPLLQVGWEVSGTGIPSGAYIMSINAGNSEITMNYAATATAAGETIKFGETYGPPTRLFDFDPSADTIAPVLPAFPGNLDYGSYITRMLILPTGQLLFSNSSNRLWVYTPNSAANLSLQPTITGVVDHGGGVYTLTGTQLDGQSAGAAYGDDAEMDENYPIIRLVSGGGSVYYCRTFNWSSVVVGGGAASQTVNFTLPSGLPNGTYSLIVSGAGISSNAYSFTVPTPQAVVTNVTSATADGTYGPGRSISIQVTFNAAVSVTGTPQLALNSGGTANYTSGSGSSALTFTYVVGATDSSAHLDYSSAGALVLNGGTISGTANNAASLVLPTPQATGSLGANSDIVVSLASNAASVVNVTSSSANGMYGPGQSISIQVVFSVPVYVTGAPQLILNSGGTANYTSGSGSATLTFTYIVGSADSTAHLDYSSAAALALNGGTISDGAGNATSLVLAVPGGTGSLGADFNIAIGSGGLHFVSITPCRVVDTRFGTGPFGAPGLNGNSRSFPIPGGTCGVPTTAKAYSLNATVIPSEPLAYLTIWPTGQPQPTVSTLNSLGGLIVANGAIVEAGSDGAISVFATNATDLVLDLNGYFQ